MSAITETMIKNFAAADHTNAPIDNIIIGDAIELARAEAVAMGAQFDAAADLARCTANAAALLSDARSPIAESVAAFYDAGLSDIEMTDDDIIEYGREWELDLPALVARLEEFIVRARDVMGVAA